MVCNVPVCMLSSVSQALHVRILRKEAGTLAKAGREVLGVEQDGRHGVVGGIKFIALPALGNHSLQWLGGCRVLRLAWRQGVDVPLLDQPERLRLRLLVKVFTKARVVCDAH